MKIGILTFHRAHNYGAMLQAYALKKVLCDLGHDVVFVGYRQDIIENAYKVIDIKRYRNSTMLSSIKIFVYRLITFRRRLIRHYRFKYFLNKYIGREIPTDSSANKIKISGLDTIIFGSDQIWTTRFLGTFDNVYWGDVNSCGAKRVAYAPSMELKFLDEYQSRYIDNHIKNFDCISVREKSMQDFLYNLQKIRYPLVLDPTLLCTKDAYSNFFKKKRSNYLLLYQVGLDETTYSIANFVAKKLSLNIIELTSEVALKIKLDVKDTVGPDSFVNLIKNADYVVSNSFHGTAFSINFNIPFLSVLIAGREERAKSLLELVGLESRGIYSLEDIKSKSLEMNEHDFEKSNNLLMQERKKSLEYLTKAIKL